MGDLTLIQWAIVVILWIAALASVAGGGLILYGLVSLEKNIRDDDE